MGLACAVECLLFGRLRTYETLYCERLILVVRTISYVCNFVLRTIISVLRTINFVLRTIIFVLWAIKLVMRTINFVLRTITYVVLYYGRLRSFFTTYGRLVLRTINFVLRIVTYICTMDDQLCTTDDYVRT